MPMAVYDLNFKCSTCGATGRGPRVTMSDGRVVCPRCYVGDPAKGIVLSKSDKR